MSLRVAPLRIDTPQDLERYGREVLERGRAKSEERRRRQERVDWRLELLAPLIADRAPYEAVRLAWALCEYQRGKSGRLYPYVLKSTSQLAEKASTNRRNIFRATRWLEAAGRLSVDRSAGGRADGKKGKANKYWLLEPVPDDVVAGALAELAD